MLVFILNHYSDKKVDSLFRNILTTFVQKIELIRKGLDEVQMLLSQNQKWTHTLNSQLDSFRILSQNDVHEIICKSSKKAFNIVIECLDVLAPILTKIVNTSVTTGKVPSSWKEAVFHPTQKRYNV